MRKLSSLLPIACLFLVLPGPAFAWVGTGHKVVAFIAWEDLTPKTKQAVTDLLKQHPRYEKDLLLDAPANETPDQQARTAFATAATWPDMVRSQSNPMHQAYSHPAWHYIDIPYVTGGVTPTSQPSDRPGPQNVIEALDQCTAELKNPQGLPAGKAVDICWVAHLIGDIHQPLHAVTWYSPAFPDGDQGGNAEVVLKTPPYPDSSEKLHLLWDTLPGDFESEELALFEAEGLRADPHYSRQSLKDQIAVTDFAKWAGESHDLAIKYAYLDGNLRTAPARRNDDPPATQPTPGVPPGYVEQAEHVAMLRVSLAGYRLADLLNNIFDPK